MIRLIWCFPFLFSFVISTPAFAVLMDMQGDINLKIENKKIYLYIEQICNDELNTISGSYRVSVWATAKPYTGAEIPATSLMLSESNQTIEGGYCLMDWQREKDYIPPANGNYYLNVVYEKWDGINYTPYDYISFLKIFHLGNNSDTLDENIVAPSNYPTPKAPSTSSSSGNNNSSSGGGLGCFINVIKY